MLAILLALQLATTTAPATAPTPERHPLLTHAAIAAVVVAEFSDLSTTEYVLGTGRAHEANPIFVPFAHEGPVAASIVKGAITTAIAFALLKAHKSHPKLTTVVGFGIAAATSAVAWHNAHLGGS